jgi:hypothetical protein
MEWRDGEDGKGVGCRVGTFIQHDHAGDSDGGVGGHLFGTESAALVTFGAEFGGAVYSVVVVVG